MSMPTRYHSVEEARRAVSSALSVEAVAPPAVHSIASSLPMTAPDAEAMAREDLRAKLAEVMNEWAQSDPAAASDRAA